MIQTRKHKAMNTETRHNTLGLISSWECSIIAYFADGYTPAQIGSKIGLSEMSVKRHLANLKQKHGLHHTYELISWAYLNGFLK